MTITREQVADLRVGDVVEVWDGAYTVRGPVSKIVEDDYFQLGMLAYTPGERKDWTLTVIKRAPRPLYVNHARAEPVPGDVVRDADRTDSSAVWLCDPEGAWWSPTERTVRMWERQYLPKRLRLLVDGETGQVVP